MEALYIRPKYWASLLPHITPTLGDKTRPKVPIELGLLCEVNAFQGFLLSKQAGQWPLSLVSILLEATPNEA